MPITSFRLGKTVATPGALEALEEVCLSPSVLLDRHRAGDWGDLSEDDREANDAGTDPADPDRLLSNYVLPSGRRVWVLTEWDRSATTLLLPDEY